MKKLTSKVALITGGARGMGANHVRRFINEGATVYFTDILENEGLELEAELGGQAIFLNHDVTSEEEWKSLAAAIDGTEGRLDILVNNAGVAGVTVWGETSLADYMRIVNINQVSTFLGLNYMLPLLKKGHNASVINISSTAGLAGFARIGGAAYCSSKYAVRGLTQVAALDFAPFHIRVNSVHPGVVDTPMTRQGDVKNRIEEVKARIPLGKIATLDDLSNMVYCSWPAKTADIVRQVSLSWMAVTWPDGNNGDWLTFFVHRINVSASQ